MIAKIRRTATHTRGTCTNCGTKQDCVYILVKNDVDRLDIYLCPICILNAFKKKVSNEKHRALLHELLAPAAGRKPAAPRTND